MVGTAGIEASPWRMRDFRLVWFGGLVNDTGDWLLRIALPVFVFIETGSGSATAVLFVVELAVATVVGPIGGSLVDRWNLRRALVLTNILQAFTLLPLLAVSAERVWPAYLVLGVQALLTQINNPASVALLPRLVPEGQLAAANAANSTSKSLARLVGSPLGGLLVAIGGLEAVVVIDGLSFLGVAVAAALIRADTSTRPAEDTFAERPSAGVVDGLRAIRRSGPLPAVLAVLSLGQVAQGFFVILFLAFVVESLGGGEAEVGFIRGAMAVGAIVGAATISTRAKDMQSTRMIAVGYLGTGAMGLVLWNTANLSTNLWLYLALAAVSGFPISVLEVGVMTTLLQLAPQETLGRLVGIVGALNAFGTAVGAVAAGVLIDVVELAALLNFQASIYLLCGVLTFAFVDRRVATSQ